MEISLAFWKSMVAAIVRMIAGDRNLANLGITRPRKLTPLANRPPMLDVSAQAKENGSGIGTITTTRQGEHFDKRISNS